MIFDNFEKTDRRIFIAALVTLLLSVFLITNDDWVYNLTGSDLGHLEPIGEIKKLKNDVRRRHKIAFTWLPARPKANVYQGDSIFTGQDSTVVISTQSGEELTIAENSLVVVKTREDAISLDIGFGSVEGKVGKGKTLRITSNNSLTELAGDNAVVKVDAGGGDKLVLNVLAGEVKIRSPEGEKTLRRNDSTEIDASGAFGDPVRSGIQIISPLADARIRHSPTVPVEFKWSTRRKFNRMKIKIAADPELKKPLVDTRVNDNSYVAYGLPADVPLYWQVLSDGAISELTPFYVVGSNPPVPVFPKIGQHFFYDAALKGRDVGVELELKWDGGSPALRYEVQLAANPQFENPKIIKTMTKSVHVGVLPMGEYYWRVRSLDFADTRFSEVATFKVGPIPTQRLAIPLAENSSVEFLLEMKKHGLPAEKIHSLRNQAAYRHVEEFPRLQWSAVAGADKYDLQISRSKDFRDLLVNTTLATNSYVWRRPPLGHFFWRIRARGELYLNSVYSPAKEIGIRLAPPVSLTRTQIIDEVPDPALLDAAPPPLELKWNPTIFTQYYHVQFSERSDFSTPLEFITEKASRRVQIPKRGVYYWRIRSLDARKAPLSPWSQSYTLEFQREYKDPRLSENLLALYPRQQDSLIVVGSRENSILFQWTRPFEDADYTLEISYDVNFDQVAYRHTVKDNKFLFTQPLESSVVYWRVRAKKGDEITPWTGANRFLVTYENTPFDFETSEKMFAARVRARERQRELLAAARRRMERMRSPAATIDIRLDTPQITFPYTTMVLDSNLDPKWSQEDLNKLAFEKFFRYVKNYPLFTWEKVSAAERYFIEIARDRDFNNIIVRAPSFNPYYLWETVRPGQYYWRVQAFNDRYTRSNYSEVRPFRVEVSPPAPLSTDVFVEVYDEPRDFWQPPAPFKLEWSPVVFARGYDVEFSEDPNFQYSNTYRTPLNSHEFRVHRAGVYYWRVRPINDHKIGIGVWSTPRSIEIVQTERRPASGHELLGVFPVNRTMVFVGKGLFDTLFYFASPKDGTYAVEISDKPDFSRILARQQGRKEKVRVRGDFPAGKLYWRVRDVQSTRGPSSSLASPIYEFILRKEPDPYVR